MLVRGAARVLGLSIFVAAKVSWAQAPAAQFPADQARSLPENPGTLPAATPLVPPEAAPGGQTPATGNPMTSPALPASSASSPPGSVAPAPVQSRPATQASLPRNWSLGGGLGAADYGGSGVLMGFVQPAYRAVLERRIGARSWLTFNGVLSHYSREAPVLPPPRLPDSPSEAWVTSTTATLLVGLRYAFVQGLVEVSGSIAAYGAVEHGGGDDLPPGANVQGVQVDRGNVGSVGAIAGLSVERELIDALGLRLSVDLSRLAYSRGDTSRLDATGEEVHTRTKSVNADVTLRPSLTLNFYF